MRRLTEVVVVPMRDGVSYYARVKTAEGSLYTKAVPNEETALMEAGLVLRDRTRGSKRKPRAVAQG